MALVWLGTAVLSSVVCFLLFSRELSSFGDVEAVIWLAVLAVLFGTAVTGMLFLFGRGRFPWSYLSLEPHAVRW